eukprot:TRINITY_DN3968_c0_g1_i1.p1 TRINITY_DN3968_c0_g1~~TRINITY_DN3968_c0_g1_i1.p1  ORF type:complete len:207 (-),score=26.22 TRINITY_DN3968_c0_g1_i1:20-640(-)
MFSQWLGSHGWTHSKHHLELPQCVVPLTPHEADESTKNGKRSQTSEVQALQDVLPCPDICSLQALSHTQRRTSGKNQAGTQACDLREMPRSVDADETGHDKDNDHWRLSDHGQTLGKQTPQKVDETMKGGKGNRIFVAETVRHVLEAFRRSRGDETGDEDSDNDISSFYNSGRYGDFNIDADPIWNVEGPLGMVPLPPRFAEQGLG